MEMYIINFKISKIETFYNENNYNNFGEIFKSKHWGYCVHNVCWTNESGGLCTPSDT